MATKSPTPVEGEERDGEQADNALEPVFNGSRTSDPVTHEETAVASRYSYFEHDNAIFRRDDTTGGMAVDDVLVGRKWQPYEGADALKPAMFGERIPDHWPAPKANSRLDSAGSVLLLFRHAR